MRQILMVLILITTVMLFGQSEKENPVLLSGYVKHLQSGYFFNEAFPDLQQGKLVDTFLQDNLIHHRLNGEWLISDHWRLQAGLRTRIFYGDLVRANLTYADQVNDDSNDWLNMSAVWLDQGSFVGHSVLDRLYTEYSKEQWEVRVGRQRVNWGISTIWNPNDIFNAYNFTDFDYEERPGADAIRARYYTGYSGSVEVAVRGADQLRDMVMAGRWLFNTGSYDVQVIGGYTQGDWVVGGGWAGNIKNAGFKGELSWFIDQEGDDNSLAITANADYAFEKGLYLNGGLLYNSEGATDADALNLFAFELSARNLYPYRWATFMQLSYPISPLLTAGLANIYSPVARQALFVNPTLSLSMANNWTLDLVGQLVFNKDEERYRSPTQVAFLRIKFSY